MLLFRKRSLTWRNFFFLRLSVPTVSSVFCVLVFFLFSVFSVFFLSFRLSVFLSVCLSVFLSLCVSVFFVCLCLFFSVSLYFSLSAVYLSYSLSLCVSFSLPLCLVYWFTYQNLPVEECVLHYRGVAVCCPANTVVPAPLLPATILLKGLFTKFRKILLWV